MKWRCEIRDLSDIRPKCILDLGFWLRYEWIYRFAVLCTANHTHSQQVGICRHGTGNAHINKHGGTLPVILARHRLRLPDDGSCVNRNMSEQIL